MLRHVLPRILVAMMLAPWLTGCESARTPPRAALIAAAGEPVARRAEIARQISRICPASMTPAELRRAADYVEVHPDALPLVTRLDLFDRQSHICRGEAP